MGPSFTFWGRWQGLLQRGEWLHAGSRRERLVRCVWRRARRRAVGVDRSAVGSST